MSGIKNILVVDDEKDLLELTTKVLSRSGYNVLTASSGHSAQHILKDRTDIDLVLSDIKMPDGDGIDLLKSIKYNNPKRPTVALFTGFYDFSIDELFDMGVCAVVMKPFEWGQIEKMLQEQLKAFPKFKKPYLEHANVALKIEETYPSLKESVGSSKMFNIGRGGIFIRTKTEVKVGELVKFKFNFSQSEPQTFEGLAEVAWQRFEETKGLPAGIGAKFVNMAEETETFLNNYTDLEKTVAYIPKS